MQRHGRSSGTTVVLVLSGAESERALPAARSVATRFAARIVVLHVIEFDPSVHEGRRPLVTPQTRRECGDGLTARPPVDERARDATPG